MKIECTVDELKEVLNYRNSNIKLDGKIIGTTIQPSINNTINRLDNHD